MLESNCDLKMQISGIPLPKNQELPIFNVFLRLCNLMANFTSNIFGMKQNIDRQLGIGVKNYKACFENLVYFGPPSLKKCGPKLSTLVVRT